MNLSVAIVGLPNVGKSTLFNALLKRQQALAANYPFATIEPNTGIVEVPDGRLLKLAEVVAGENTPLVSARQPLSRGDNSPGFQPALSLEKRGNLPPLKPATIEFVDIAGLVAGASKGEGLGNQFLAHIRETNVICHVLRAFEDENVVITGKLDPYEDLQTVRMELILKDLETVEKSQKSKVKNQSEKVKLESVLNKVCGVLEAGKMANSIEWSDEELEAIQPLHLLSAKPELFVINVSEEQIKQGGGYRPSTRAQAEGVQGLEKISETDIVHISAKIESELSDLDEADQQAYLSDLGLKQSGIEQMAQAAYRKLGLISFLTAGEIECRAWTIKHGTLAPQAAGTIHTDFEKKFIKAQVIDWQDFVNLGGWKKAREVGKVRQEGRDYMLRDGDVVEFMIGR